VGKMADFENFDPGPPRGSAWALIQNRRKCRRWRHDARFSGFCIVSSDSDFARLAARIREQDVTVYGLVSARHLSTLSPRVVSSTISMSWSKPGRAGLQNNRRQRLLASSRESSLKTLRNRRSARSMLSTWKSSNPTGSAAGASIRDLFRSSLRMRPDRIIVGECRGGEALDMIQAMTSGHSGSLSTVDANTPYDALHRLETLALMSDLDMPLEPLRAQIRHRQQLRLPEFF